MAGAQITFGKLESGEYVGMREAMQRFPGLRYSSLRAYVRSGRLPALRGPNNRLLLAVRDLEALYKPVQPNTQPTQGD
jgi:hypothetical protein